MSKTFLLAIYAGILIGASPREGDLAADVSQRDHSTAAPDARQVKTASGPLRVHPTNPRFFTDDSGRALYFAGSDTYGLNHKFDKWPTFTGRWSYFVEFLDWMESHNQNFLRCWGGFSYLVSDRHPWQRTGPGRARDGDPKFDMSRFDQSYFDMLKGRLAEIQRRGLHTSITIFGSYNRMRNDFGNTAWHPDNNVNPDIASAFSRTDPHSFFTKDPAALKIQRMLIAKFVDELNEYDCQIWEIMNETGVAPEIRDWYYGMVEYVKAYEAGKPKQHLVGMTPGWDRGKRQPKEWLYHSPADWIQIGGGAGPADEFATGGSATYTDKLLFLDTDHTPWHTQKNADAKSIQKWVWKTFTRGHHPLMLEMYRHGDEMPGLDIVCEHPIPFFHRRELTGPETAVGVIAANLKFGKPVICDETGYFPPPTSTEDAVWRTVTQEQLANERRAFWYAFVAGGHWTAVCWQDFQERDTHRWIRHLKSLIDSVPFWKMDPHDELVDRGHCLAWPDKYYVIYLGDGGKTTLQLSNQAADAFLCEWIDPRSGKRQVAKPEVHGRKITFKAPSHDDWAIYIRSR